MRSLMWAFAVIAVAQFLTVPCALAASALPSFRADGDAVIATGAGGRDLWRRHMTHELLPLMIEPQPDGSALVNGQTLIRPDGGIQATAVPTDSALSATSYTWDTPGIVKNVASVAFVPQLVDKKGNIWTVLDDGEGNSARVMQYVVKKATWKQLAKLPRDFAFGHFDLDPLGNVTLVALLFSTTDGDSLSVVRFEPDTGWVGPTTVYNRPYAPNAMLNFDIAADKLGNAVVVASDEDRGGVSVVYSYAQRAWLPAETIPLPPDHGPGAVRFIALSRSPNAKYLSLAYLGSLPDKTGTLQLAYYSSKFNSNKLAFGSAEQLPGSFAVAGDNQYVEAGGYQVKMALDNSGNESVVWPSGPNI